MTNQEQEAMDRQRQIIDEVTPLLDGKPTAAAMRAVANALVRTARNEGLPEREHLNAMAFVGGMAAGMLVNAAHAAP